MLCMLQKVLLSIIIGVYFERACPGKKECAHLKEKTQRQTLHGVPNMDRDYQIFHYLDGWDYYAPLHSHNFYELYFLISGSLSYQIGNTIFAVKPGDILLFGINQPHRPLFSGQQVTYERIVLRISEKMLRQLSDEEDDLAACFKWQRFGVYRFSLETQNNIRLLLSRLIAEQDRGQDNFGSGVLYKAYLTELMVLFRRNCEENAPQYMSDPVKKRQMIEIVNHYIEENLERHISVAELAEHVYLSKYYFMRFFKEMTGTSVYQYIIQKRLVGASNLIMEGVPVASVYLYCGFGDYTSFLRAFKKQFGYSPKQYAEYLAAQESN